MLFLKSVTDLLNYITETISIWASVKIEIDIRCIGYIELIYGKSKHVSPYNLGIDVRLYSINCYVIYKVKFIADKLLNNLPLLL